MVFQIEEKQKLSWHHLELNPFANAGWYQGAFAPGRLADHLGTDMIFASILTIKQIVWYSTIWTTVEHFNY